MKNSYWVSFITFFRIGLFTIGGGLAMVPLIEQEVVKNKGWINKDEFLDLMAIAQSMPGIFAVNFAILIGYRMNRFWGSLVTGLGTVLPSFLIILLIAIGFTSIKDNAYVLRIFKGMRPAVVALILVPVLTSAKRINLNWKSLLLVFSVAGLIAFLAVNPVYIILVIAILSILYGNYKRKRGGENRC